MKFRRLGNGSGGDELRGIASSGVARVGGGGDADQALT
jgi:hypothetical protein